MMDIIERTREEAVNDLACGEFDDMSEREMIDVLVEGCPGWKSLAWSETDLKDYYRVHLHKELIIRKE